MGFDTFRCCTLWYTSERLGDIENSHLHENESSTEGFPVADGKRAQVEADSSENSCHHALPVERRPAAPRTPVPHFSQLVAHDLVVLLPVGHLKNTYFLRRGTQQQAEGGSERLAKIR